MKMSFLLPIAFVGTLLIVLGIGLFNEGSIALSICSLSAGALCWGFYLGFSTAIERLHKHITGSQIKRQELTKVLNEIF